MPEPMTDERRRCGAPCLTHAHTCDRSPRHTGVHRDVQQKGNHTCEWDTPRAKDVPALLAALERLRADLEAMEVCKRQAGERLVQLEAELDRLEADRDRIRDERNHLRERLAETDQGATILALEETIAAADKDRERLAEKVRRLQLVRTYRNEDGKDFVFVEDLFAALNGEEA